MSDQTIKILSSKKVFSATLFHINELKVEFPNGTKATHHVVERRPCVYIFPLTPKYELYFVKEYNYSTNDFEIKPPAGFMEEGENPLQAAKRELREETGILAGQWEEFSRMKLAKSSLDATVYLFLARDLEIKKSQPDATEDIEVIKLSFPEAVQKVMDGEIRQAPVIAGILLLDKLRLQKRL